MNMHHHYFITLNLTFESSDHEFISNNNKNSDEYTYYNSTFYLSTFNKWKYVKNNKNIIPRISIKI
jgi:hypothetical protein